MNLGSLTWEPLLNLLKTYCLCTWWLTKFTCIYFTCFILHFTFYLHQYVLLVLTMMSKLCISFRTKPVPDKMFSYQTSLFFFVILFFPPFLSPLFSPPLSFLTPSFPPCLPSQFPGSKCTLLIKITVFFFPVTSFIWDPYPCYIFILFSVGLWKSGDLMV